MSYKASGCRALKIQDLDIDDLSSIYHPLARSGVEIFANTAALFSPTFYVAAGDLAYDFNGNQVEVAHKYAFFKRDVAPESSWKYVRSYDLDFVNQDGKIDIGYDPWSEVYELTDRPRTEYMLVGLSKGDPKRTEGLEVGAEYSVLWLDGESWTLGEPAVAADPARPGSGSGGSTRGPGGSGTGGGPGAPGPAAVEDPSCTGGDGHDWVLREGGDGGWWCYRLDVAAAVSTVIWRCAASAGDLRVGIGGAVECVRDVLGTVRSRLGVPGCAEGFLLLTVMVRGAAQQVCSRTESEPARSSVSYSCDDDGYTPSGSVCEKSVAATATTKLGCRQEYSLVTVLSRGVSRQMCQRSVAATATTKLECRQGYSLVRYFVQPGVAGHRCERSEDATATTKLGCRQGYSLVTVLSGGVSRQVCQRSVAATATTKLGCRQGYSLVRYFVQPGVAGHRCERSVAAKATTRLECRTGYSLVTVPLGGRYCSRSVSAAASYSCDSGYTRSGTNCYKYTYTSLTGSKCPTGSTLFYNGIFYLCRKKITTPATVTYSCSSGRLSGSKCVFTATPTSKTTYSCSSGRLSGTKCVFTATPTSKTTYSCSSGRLSGTKCVFTATPTSKTTYSCNAGTLSGSKCVFTAAPTSKTTYSCNTGTLSGSKCVFTAAPTSKTTYSCSSGRLSGSNCVFTTAATASIKYDCDDAPAGYTLSGEDCTKTTTEPPTRPTIHYCDPGYNHNPNNNTCKQPTITPATKLTAYGCPSVPPSEPRYRLVATTTATGTTRTCERTIAVAAATTPTCPEPAEGEDPYTLTVTTDSDGRTTHNCTPPADDEDGG